MHVGILYINEQSHWKSCQSIMENLKKSYEKVFNTSNYILPNDLNFLDIKLVIDKILKEKPSHLAILDHREDVIKIINLLDKALLKLNTKYRPQIIIHVFGDFTLFSRTWLEIEKSLSHFQVKFICASEKQKSLVSHFLKKHDSIYIAPFPVNERDFKFSQLERSDLRNKMGHLNSDKIFLYTGRLSQQKNVLYLLKCFELFTKISKVNTHLYLAGSFDDLGVPYRGVYYREGQFYAIFKKTLDSLAPEARNRIHYLGNLNVEELRSVYCAADMYVSLSTHNDEDYGMAPAEALMTGLPCVLTRWGGFSSFQLKAEEETCTLIDVKIEDEGLSIDELSLLKNLFLHSHSDEILESERLRIQKCYNKILSVSAVSKMLHIILSSQSFNFTGFSSKMRDLKVAYDGGSPYIELEIKKKYNHFYKKLYGSYVSK